MYEDEEVTIESNRLFWKAFRLAGNLKDDRRIYYHEIRLAIDAPLAEGEIAENHYKKVIEEIETELGIRIKNEEIKPNQIKNAFALPF